jgi:hypothetical protein
MLREVDDHSCHLPIDADFTWAFVGLDTVQVRLSSHFRMYDDWCALRGAFIPQYDGQP